LQTEIRISSNYPFLSD